MTWHVLRICSGPNRQVRETAGVKLLSLGHRTCDLLMPEFLFPWCIHLYLFQANLLVYYSVTASPAQTVGPMTLILKTHS